MIQKFAAFRLQVLRTRDFAITTVENAIKLKEGRADYDAAVIAAQ
jgi:hypothetical protein